MSEIEYGAPPGMLDPLRVKADWPADADRVQVAGCSDAELAERAAASLLPGWDRSLAKGVIQGLLRSGDVGDSTSEQGALGLGVAQRVAYPQGWVLVPVAEQQGLPGVDSGLERQVAALDPDAVAENVAGIIRQTNPDLNGYATTNAMLAFQNTEWGNISPEEKAHVLTLLGPILGAMRVGMHVLPPLVEQEGGQ